METHTVDIEENVLQLGDLLALTSQGTEVIIARGDHLLARLVPMEKSSARVGNLNPGSIETTEDFDAPLPDEFWLGEE